MNPPPTLQLPARCCCRSRRVPQTHCRCGDQPRACWLAAPPPCLPACHGAHQHKHALLPLSTAARRSGVPRIHRRVREGQPVGSGGAHSREVELVGTLQQASGTWQLRSMMSSCCCADSGSHILCHRPSTFAAPSAWRTCSRQRATSPGACTPRAAPPSSRCSARSVGMAGSSRQQQQRCGRQEQQRCQRQPQRTAAWRLDLTCVLVLHSSPADARSPCFLLLTGDRAQRRVRQRQRARQGRRLWRGRGQRSNGR